MAGAEGPAYTKLPSSDKWEFKGISVLTVKTHIPSTTSEVDLRTEMDFWDTCVPDKSPKAKTADTPAVAEQPEVLFDANDDHPKDDEGSDDGLTHTDELQTLTSRPMSPISADHVAGDSRTQSGRVLLSRACSRRAIRSPEASAKTEDL